MPDDIGLLSVDPVAAPRVEREVEVEDDSGHDETHLGVGEAVSFTRVSIVVCGKREREQKAAGKTFLRELTSFRCSFGVPC